LIQLKDDLRRAVHCFSIKRRTLMPVDSMLVAASVVVMFVVFAGVLAWGDSQTRTKVHQSSAKRRPF